MKTSNINLVAVAAFVAAFIFTGCTNPEVDVRKSVEITLHPSTILSGFTPYKSSNFDMFSDKDGESALRITCLLYDEAGKLCFSDEAAVEDFYKDVTFSTPVDDEASYTLVALATCIQGPLSSPTYEAYTISDTGYLQHLKVKQIISNSLYSSLSVMGYASCKIESSEKVFLNMEPGTALVYIQYKNIHAHDNDGVFNGGVDMYAMGISNNNLLQFSNLGAATYSQIDGTDPLIPYIEPANNPEATNIYEMYNLYPGIVTLLGFVASGNDISDFSAQTVDIEPGHQYVFSMDCSALKLTASESVLGSKSKAAGGVLLEESSTRSLKELN